VPKDYCFPLCTELHDKIQLHAVVNDDQEDVPVKKKKKSLCNSFDELKKKKKKIKKSTDLSNERKLSLYCSAEYINRKKDPLGWWKKNMSHFPT